MDQEKDDEAGLYKFSVNQDAGRRKHLFKVISLN